MLDKPTRPARGLPPYEALRKWGDPEAFAKVDRHGRPIHCPVSVVGSRMPHEIGYEAYRQDLKPMNAALLEQLRSGELVASAIDSNKDAFGGRRVVEPSSWDLLSIAYEHEKAARRGCTLDALEIFDPRERPANILYVPSWLSAMETGTGGPFSHTKDFRHVRLDGRDYHLGELQAEVVKLLHDAVCRDDPWQSGKEVLDHVGSQSRNMGELFKSQKDWRLLIESDQRGNYRLCI